MPLDETLAPARRQTMPPFELALRALAESAGFDPALRLGGVPRSRLLAKWIAPSAYRPSDLFDAMARGEGRLFTDFPIDARTRNDGGIEQRLIPAIHDGFPAQKRARVRSRGAMRYQSIPDVMRRWHAEKSCFGVTDLHYIGTRFDRRIHTRALNAFNLLPRGAEGHQSQDSLVISTRGAVTDSHSDDHGGSNHCFVGRKIWLLWETLEGFGNGLEDTSHHNVKGRARFDSGAFFALKSSRWISIGPGQTMFIPAHLSHRVITLDRYIGLGSFNLALPALPDVLERWHTLKPQWSASMRAYADPIQLLVDRAVRKLRRLKESPAEDSAAWGVAQLAGRLRESRRPRSPYLRQVAEALA